MGIPDSDKPRVVILGAGFAGLRLARKLIRSKYQVVLIDRNNYHQFQPLFYQVATSGLAPSSISFPVRLILKKAENVHFRLAEVQSLDLDSNIVHTNIGELSYDHLVVALGATTNFFGNASIEQNAFPMKSVSEALDLRNRIIERMEEALISDDPKAQDRMMSIVVVGGGPTGTEVAGALSEMKKFVLPNDYPELDFEKMTITLLEGSAKLLNGMSEASSKASFEFLRSMGVDVRLNSFVESYDGKTISLNDGSTLESTTLIWAAGIRGATVKGIPEQAVQRGQRVSVDEFNRLDGSKNVYVLGDLAIMPSVNDGRGDPQVAQVAIQQADNLYKNLTGSNWKPFRYKDLGSMATIGRNKAVVDLPYLHFRGFFAWTFWLFVHLMAILGVKNKFFIFLEWMWSYITFDQNLRLVIKKGDQN